MALIAAGLLPACKPATHTEEAAPKPADPQRPAAISVIKAESHPSTPSVPPPKEIWKEFSGEKAFDHARKQVEVGARPAGSPELEKARLLIESALKESGWDAERQEFKAETPHGPITFVNIVARFSANGQHPASRTTQKAIVCSHYDTKLFSTIKFVGASDGASSTGSLLELARVLALDPPLASQIELVFFDGEEAVVQFTDPDAPQPDGLYGSRYYARALAAENRASQFKFGILWDMIGDADLDITMPPDAPKPLSAGIQAAAETLGLGKYFGFYKQAILDDHEELMRRARIPTLDLIDFDYIYWHSQDDTLEHISANSLQIVGSVTLYYLQHALGR